MYIKNRNEYRAWRSILNLLEREYATVENLATEKKIIAIKRGLRAFAHRPADYDRRILKGDYDGYISLERLPDDIESKEEAQSFFNDFMTYRYRPAAYDCTGQLFTNWFKVFRRNGGFYAYHSVSFDV